MNKKARHANWFKEVKLNNNITVRYYYFFRNRPDLNEKWVIRFLAKNGKPQYKVIDEMTASLILKSHGKSFKDMVEVISKAFKDGTEFRRIVFNPRELDVFKVDVTKLNGNSQSKEVKII